MLESIYWVSRAKRGQREMILVFLIENFRVYVIIYPNLRV